MCRNWDKELTKEERKVVDMAMDKLRTLINTIEATGTPFEKIFNNDVIKYDVLGHNFFTFKYKGPSSTQARILYRFNRINEQSYTLDIHKVYIKRKDFNKGKSNEYIRIFENYVNNYIKTHS